MGPELCAPANDSRSVVELTVRAVGTEAPFGLVGASTLLLVVVTVVVVPSTIAWSRQEHCQAELVA